MPLILPSLKHRTSWNVFWYPGGGGVLGTKDHGDVPLTWVAKSASWYINDSLFNAKFGTDIWMGQFLSFLSTLSQVGLNLRTFEKKSGNLVKIWPKMADWYMNVSLLLAKLVYAWVQFQIPSGTSLPKPNLSYPRSGTSWAITSRPSFSVITWRVNDKDLGGKKQRKRVKKSMKKNDIFV